MILRRAAYDSASINGCGLLPENVGRPWPKERIPYCGSISSVSGIFTDGGRLNIWHWDVRHWHHVHAQFRDDRPHGLKAELRDRGPGW